MEMGNCKDCEHWEVSMSRLSQHDWGLCMSIEGTEMDTAHADDGAGIYLIGDSSEASGVLETGPLFGCTKFAPRTET